jgi:hypothetical protein
VTVGGVAGTGLGHFSFDAPAVSGIKRNSPHSGMGSVTVTGLQFGIGEHSATVGVEMAACLTSAWTSMTSVGCLGSGLAQIFGYSGVTVGGIAGTGEPVFSFDAVVASGVLGNAPHSGMGSVTVTGLQFGIGEHTATGVVGLAACHCSSWASATSLSCLMSSFAGYPGYVQVTVGAVGGTGASVFSFDSRACLVLGGM